MTYRNAEASQQGREKNLQAILERVKGKGRYDCLVPLSGGKDSSYVLFLAAKKYGMNVLAYTFDNGFRAKQAVDNTERAVNSVGADLLVYRIRPDIMMRMFRAFLTKAGEFCSPCNWMIGQAAQEIARHYKIRLILSGDSSRTSAAIEVMSHARYYDRDYIMNLLSGEIPDRTLRAIIGHPYHVKSIYSIAGLWPTTISVLDYHDVSIAEMVETISRELGWKKPGEEAEHGDCRITCLKDFIMCKKWGCSELTGYYCALIRNGEVSREEGLEKAEAEEPREPPQILHQFLEQIQMKESEFDKALERDFREIPNRRRSATFRLAKKALNGWLKFRGKK
jgi:hypothetical protein